MTKHVVNGNMLEEVGHAFFADKKRTEEETNEFITVLLQSGAYENLATVMCCGCINKHGGEDGFLPGGRVRYRLADRYFQNFIELAEQSGVDKELIYPMLFSAFDAPKDSRLHSFVGGIDTFLTKMAYDDYDSAAEIIARYDKKYKCLSILMEVDEARTLEKVLNDLIYGKNVNKTALRQYLLEKKVDIVPALCKEYVKSNVKAKEGIVRLLLLYKNEPRAALFLDEIEKNERSAVIKKLLCKDKSALKRRSEIRVHGNGGRAYVTVDEDGQECTISLTDDLSLQFSPAQYGDKTKKAAEDFLQRVKAACMEFEKSMSANERKPYDVFVKYVLRDSLLCAIAGTVLFSVYKNGVLSDIVVVDKGEILDLENNKKVLSDVEIAVSHPVEWGTRFAFLRQLDIKQPFAQIKREIYNPIDSEKAYNFCSRVHGTIMEAGDFKAALRKYGFKILNKNKYGESNCAALLRGDVMCVLEFSATDFGNAKRLISMGDIRFYQYADVIKLGGQMYTDGVMPYPVQSLPSIAFSEFLYTVFKMLRL